MTTTPASQNPDPDVTPSIRKIPLAAIVLWVTFVLWMAFVFWLSSLSPKDFGALPKMFRGFDKVVHFGLFFSGSIFLTMAIRQTKPWPWWAVILTSVVALSLFGVGDEYHQLFTTGRNGADLGDWSADFLGSLTAALCCYLVSRLRGREATAPLPNADSPAAGG